MVAEIFGGISAFKAMFDLAKGLKDIDDATRRNAVAIELQEKILAAREAQSAALERIGELEKQVADFEGWDTEKKRYELKNIGHSCFARMLKPEARAGEPPHFICANCYEQRRIFVIQRGPPKPQARAEFFCPSCGTILRPGDEAFANGSIRWIDNPGAN
jgi:hypothetical protein